MRNTQHGEYIVHGDNSGEGLALLVHESGNKSTTGKSTIYEVQLTILNT